jgi:hypothetical protein
LRCFIFHEAFDRRANFFRAGLQREMAGIIQEDVVLNFVVVWTRGRAESKV